MTIKIGDGLDLEHTFPGQSFLSAWDTPEAFARHIEKIDQNKVWNTDPWTENDPSFYGVSMRDTLKLAKEGWEQGAYRVERLSGLILAASPIIKRPVQYGIVGAVPSVPRAVAGNPLNMKKMESAISRRRPVITLVSDMSANCGTNHTAITNRAAVVCAMIDHIEAAGFATEVITVGLTRGGYGGQEGYKVLTSIKIKESTHSVDIKRLAFSLGHVGMFRRMVFADWFNEPSAKAGLGHNLGSVYKLSLDGLAEKNVFIIPSAEGNGQLFASEEKATKEGLKYLIDALKKQGCPAFPLTAKEKQDMLDRVF